MRAEYIEKMKHCSLRNGELLVPGITSDIDIKQFGDELRELILCEDLPHYKVIGVKITAGNSNLLTDYITKAKGVNRSYAELLGVFDKLIYASTEHIVGDVENDTIFYGIWYDIPDKSVGYLMGISNDIKSDNDTIFYQQLGMNNRPTSLVKGLDVVKFSNSDACIHLIIRKGTGCIEFSEVSAMLHKSDYVPVGQVYDLSQILSIKMWDKGDTAITFRYKTKVDESVLQSILVNYAIGES